MLKTIDVLVIGAGAAGMMCAATAAYRGRRVVLVDHANKAGKKILMSGGGRCNFTNLATGPQHFLSQNPHFCRSALQRYKPTDFVELVERHGVDFVEKAPGQLFCAESSKDIQQLLLQECEWAGVQTLLKTSVSSIEAKSANSFIIKTSAGNYEAESLVVATGGLSIPKMGATGFGYDIAKQFGLQLVETRAGLVPFCLGNELHQRWEPLAGVSCHVNVSCGEQRFSDAMLVTHRGLSGPAMLQISSFWQPGQSISIDFMPSESVEALIAAKKRDPNKLFKTLLSHYLPKRLSHAMSDWFEYHKNLQLYSVSQLADMLENLQNVSLKPQSTEGYRTAEVTLGGVDTQNISSKTFAVQDIPNLYFVGEVLDVTGFLGGFNFQWAWASGFAAGQYA